MGDGNTDRPRLELDQGEVMLDEIDRVYFMQRLGDAIHRADESKDPGVARAYRSLAIEYERELRELGSAGTLAGDLAGNNPPRRVTKGVT